MPETDKTLVFLENELERLVSVKSGLEADIAKTSRELGRLNAYYNEIEELMGGLTVLINYKRNGVTYDDVDGSVPRA